MKKKQKRFLFTCQRCGCNGSQEVVTDVIMRGQVKAVSKDGKLEYKHLDLSDGKTSHFECCECGRLILDSTGKKITTKAQFIQWLKRQKELN